jgi:hypothetical protein
MSESILVKSQKRVFGPKPITNWGHDALIKATVRYDDECRNGHNTFAITGKIFIPGQRDCEACGCLHSEIAEYFPELAPLIRWHLCSSDGPMHYIANTVYHVGKQDLNAARATAIWPDATDEDLTAPWLKGRLEARLPRLLEDFRAAVESLGFVF